MREHASERIVSVALGPLPNRALVATGVPVRVYFTAGSSAAGPTPLDIRLGRWKVRESDDDYRVTNEFFNGLQDAKVAGVRLLEFITWDGVSMWQFLPSYVWPAFFRAIEMIRVLREVIRASAAGELQVFVDDGDVGEAWEGVARALAETEGIPVVVVRRRRRSGTRLLRSLRQLARGTGLRAAVTRAQHYVVGVVVRAVGGARRAHVTSARGKHLLFATFVRHWVPKPFEPGARYDEQLSPLLGALRAAGWTQVTAIDCPYGQIGPTAASLQQKLESREGDVDWSRTFYSYGYHWGVRRAARKHFGEQWRTVRRDAPFRRAFSFEGVPLLPALERVLDHAFRVILPNCAEMLSVAETILRDVQPDALMATYETGPYQRALIIQAGKHGVPTVALMHGMMFSDNYNYMHRGIAPSSVGGPREFVAADVICVWGPFWKDVLTKSGHFPPSAVSVTGPWRYDDAYQRAGSAAAEDVKKALGFAADDRIVLIATGGDGTPEYVRECLEALLIADVGATPLVKLHPSVDPRPVRKLVTELGHAPRTLADRPLLEAIVAADLVVSQVSTAISEAILLDRPVVLMDPLRQSVAAAYLEAGACLCVTDPKDLPDAIAQGLGDQKIQVSLADNRRKLVSQYFSPLDGRAAERVAQALVTVSRGVSGIRAERDISGATGS